MNPLDALAKFEAGATLVQVYTGLVYAGPSLVKQINRALLTRELITDDERQIDFVEIRDVQQLTEDVAAIRIRRGQRGRVSAAVRIEVHHLRCRAVLVIPSPKSHAYVMNGEPLVELVKTAVCTIGAGGEDSRLRRLRRLAHAQIVQRRVHHGLTLTGAGDALKAEREIHGAIRAGVSDAAQHVAEPLY